MDQSLLQHYYTLVESMYLLNQDSISNADIDKAEIQLKNFVEIFQYNYGIEHLSYNCHILTHMAETTRRLGNLFESSCFPKESLNGKMKSSILGSRYPEEKIAETFCLTHNLAGHIEELPENSIAMSFVNHLKNRKIPSKLKKIKENIYALGNDFDSTSLLTHFYNTYPLDIIESTLLASGIEKLETAKVQFFSKLQIGKNQIVAKSHIGITTKNSYCIEYQNIVKKKNKIAIVDLFFRVANCDCDKTPKDCLCPSEYYALLTKCKKRAIPGLQLNNFVNKLIVTNKFHAIDIKYIVTMCAFLEFDGDYFSARRVNTSEDE